MAVPKRKTTPSKRNMRRSHHALRPINLSIDRKTGEHRLGHNLNPEDGTYSGRDIITPKVSAEESEESTEN